MMGSKAQDNCGNCSEKLPKSGDYASCSSCSNGFHFEKCSIKKQSWFSMGASKQSTWVCPNCRKTKKSSSQAEEDENELSPNLNDDVEVSSLSVQKSILTKVNALMDIRDKVDNIAESVKKIDSIETSLKFLAEKYDVLLEEVAALRAENKEMKAELKVMKEKEKTYKETTDKLTSEVSELDQYGRRMNLEIHGVKVVGDPRGEKMTDVLKKLAEDINVEYHPQEVHQAHRLQSRRDGKPPTIIVQFFSKTSRDMWLQQGRKAKLGNIFFNENLSPFYRELLKEAKLRARTHGYKFVWFRGGRVMVRRGENESNILVIRTWDDLKKIK